MAILGTEESYQSFKNQLTVNATQCVSFRTKDTSELDDLYESVGGEIDKDQFMKAYEYATSDKHGALVIDLHPKKGMPYLRKNLNEMLYFET